MNTDDIAYCGTLAKAASGMGMVGHEVKDNETQSQFILVDNMVGVQIVGRPDKDRQIAFMNTCKVLEKYLSPEVVD